MSRTYLFYLAMARIVMATAALIFGLQVAAGLIPITPWILFSVVLTFLSFVLALFK